jgi:hypothetical protein
MVRGLEHESTVSKEFLDVLVGEARPNWHFVLVGLLEDPVDRVVLLEGRGSAKMHVEFLDDDPDDFLLSARLVDFVHESLECFVEPVGELREYERYGLRESFVGEGPWRELGTKI